MVCNLLMFILVDDVKILSWFTYLQFSCILPTAFLG